MRGRVTKRRSRSRSNFLNISFLGVSLHTYVCVNISLPLLHAFTQTPVSSLWREASGRDWAIEALRWNSLPKASHSDPSWSTTFGLF
jgi:hypothetical protein